MPLDENLVINKEEVKTYPPIPKNIYQAELLSIDSKEATGKFSNPGDKNLVFQFTILSGKDKDQDLRGRNVWENFAQTSIYIGKNGKNTTWQIIEAFLGRELTPEEEAGGINGKLLNSFIGKQVKIFVDHKLSNGKVYNRITSYITADEQLTPLTDEEKESAKVKVKKEAVKDNEDESEIDVSSIPF
jgi:hypothetical protein